jgi:histidinol-phosphate aminotransferase
MKTAARFADLPAYTPIEPFEVLSARLGMPMEQIVKMDANENPYGPSPRVLQALAGLNQVNIYPDPESRALRAALAGFCGVPVQNLMAGSGADELIDLLLRVMLEPEDVVLNLPPTFGMYSFDTLLNAGRLVEIPRQANFRLDLPAIRRAVDTCHPKIIFLTAPNNPDGSLPSPEEVDELLEMPVLVVLDEAYIEFTSNGGRLGEKLSRIQEVPGRQNLVVLRTFSKWAGLAGLRVGYGAFPNWLLPALWKAKQPYNVNVAANAAALASLQDLDFLAGNVVRLCAERENLFNKLSQVTFLQPFPSQANFILCRVKGRSAAKLKEDLAVRGIFVRYYQNQYLRDFIRVSVGRAEDTLALCKALEEI